MATTVLRNTLHRRLSAGGAAWTMPTTPDAINKRLEDIAAGKGGHKPTAAHPYASCFGGVVYYRDNCTARHAGMPCHEYIARSEGRRDWANEEETA